MDMDKAKEGLASATAAAKEQFDALKTNEGRDALKDKAKEGVEGAKRIWNAASIVQRVSVLVVVVLATIFLTRSCDSGKTVVVAASNTQQGNSQQGNSQQDEKAAPKFDGSINLAKANDKTDSQKTFAGFTFGTKADKFKNIKEEEQKYPYNGKKVKFCSTVSELNNKFRLFKSAVLDFTRDKRLFKITLQTEPEDLVGYKPTSIMREAQYCAAIIERKYGGRFNIASNVKLYETKDDKAVVSDAIESRLYLIYDFSDFAIAPFAYYHGFFNNTIEIKCTCGAIKVEDKSNPGVTIISSYLGITITAMDHSIIEEEGGRTKVIKFDADDDEGNL